MEHPKLNNYPDMKVTLRKDFYDFFAKELKQFFEETGCSLFGHNVIKNYRKEGHAVSTFNTNEKWHELYWDKYRNDDPTERACHSNALINNVGLSSWGITDGKSECSEDRLSICDVKDGFLLAYSHPDNVIENISFGWKTIKSQYFDLEKALKISHIILPLRQFHIENAFSS